MMKLNQFRTTRMSPCVRIFIESLLEGAAAGFTIDELFDANDQLASAPAIGASLASDKNYN